MARLPNPGGDAGTWGQILNDFLTVDHNSDGTLKTSGSLAAKADDTAVVHVAGSETVTGNKNFTGNLQHNGSAVVDTTDARLNNQVSYYPVQGYGFFSMPDTPGAFTWESNVGSGVFFVRMWVPAGQAIGKIGVILYTPGTLGAGGENRFAIYDDSGVLVQMTPNNNSLWAGPQGWTIATLGTPIAAQSSGRFVYAGYIANGYTGDAHLIFCNPGSSGLMWYGGNGVVNRRLMYNNGVASFPASFNPATYGNNTSYMPMVALG
jgi:hypothetical protein